MYNTQTNVISSIPDFNIILKVIADYSQGKPLGEIKDNLITGNIYGIRTKSSRVRFYTAINSTFLHFKSTEHEKFINKYFENFEEVMFEINQFDKGNKRNIEDLLDGPVCHETFQRLN